MEGSPPEPHGRAADLTRTIALRGTRSKYSGNTHCTGSRGGGVACKGFYFMLHRWSASLSLDVRELLTVIWIMTSSATARPRHGVRLASRAGVDRLIIVLLRKLRMKGAHFERHRCQPPSDSIAAALPIASLRG